MGLQTSTGAGMVDQTFEDAQVVTPNNTISAATRLSPNRGIYVDVAGTVTVITDKVAQLADKTGSALTAGQAVTFVMTAGQTLPLNIAYVLVTVTGPATGIKVFY